MHRRMIKMEDSPLTSQPNKVDLLPKPRNRPLTKSWSWTCVTFERSTADTINRSSLG